MRRLLERATDAGYEGAGADGPGRRFRPAVGLDSAWLEREKMPEKVGKVRILVNNAGITKAGLLIPAPGEIGRHYPGRTDNVPGPGGIVGL